LRCVEDGTEVAFEKAYADQQRLADEQLADEQAVAEKRGLADDIALISPDPKSSGVCKTVRGPRS
jgi:hypothetical protein